MKDNIEKILFHESTIFSRLDELSQQITEDYKDKDITVISILNGSFIFMADLLRRIQLPLRLDCISVSSYHGERSSGEITFRQNDIQNVCNRHVLLLDDILDSGLTLHTIKQKIIDEGAASVKSCVLLRKDIKRKVNEEADYVGFTIGKQFVVGYGLDYNQDYRNLPFIGVLKKEAIKA